MICDGGTFVAKLVDTTNAPDELLRHNPAARSCSILVVLVPSS